MGNALSLQPLVVPNSVLSNWRKEAQRASTSTDDCLFVGLRVSKEGKAEVSSSNFDADLTAQRAAGLRANRGLSSLLGFGLGVLAMRLGQDRRRYRDYGPYWWALKDAMNRNGYSMGVQTDPAVSRTYRFDDDAQTMIAADEFRTAYLQTSIVYTNEFLLDADSPDLYVLYDADMEAPTDQAIPQKS
jgi:hypothetical protein